jgi:hypothetical protein
MSPDCALILTAAGLHPLVFSHQPLKLFVGIGQPAASRDQIPVKGVQLK